MFGLVASVDYIVVIGSHSRFGKRAACISTKTGTDEAGGRSMTSSGQRRPACHGPCREITIFEELFARLDDIFVTQSRLVLA